MAYNEANFFDVSEREDFPNTDFSHNIEENMVKYPITPFVYKQFQWNRGKLQPLLNELHLAEDYNRVRKSIFSHGPEDLKRYLLKMSYHLEWYDNNIQEKWMDGKEILIRNLQEGPAFNAFLSDTLKYSIRHTLGSYNEDEEIQHSPILIDSIDYIFDPMSLIPWEIPDELDYQLLMEKPHDVNEIDLDLILSDLETQISIKGVELPEMDFIDVLKVFNTSRSFVSEHEKTCYNYERFKNSKNLPKLTSNFKFKRAYVWKNPVEARDCLVGDIDTIYTLHVCGEYLSRIGKLTFPEYKLQKFDTQRELWEKSNKNNYFIMVDIKKCGLTYPRKFFTRVLRTLGSLYPECRVFNIVAEAYEKGPSLFCDKDDRWYHTTEGVGLGMLNELITICNLLVFRLAKHNNVFPKRTTGWFFGDDQLIIVPKRLIEGDIEALLDQWTYSIRQMGITVHGHKPFSGKHGVFLEKWTKDTPISMEKRTRQVGLLLSPLLAINIVQAKDWANQHYWYWWGPTTEDTHWCFSVIRSFWGYEFHKDEDAVPYSCGGWFKLWKNGLNEDLLFVNQEDNYICPHWAKKIWYYDVKPFRFRPWKHVESMEYLISIKDKLSFDEEFSPWNDLIDRLTESERIWEYKFTRENRGYGYLHAMYEHIAKSRQVISHKPIPSYTNIYDKILSKKWNNQAIPYCVVKIGGKLQHMTEDLFKILDFEKNDDPLRTLLFLTGHTEVNPYGGTTAASLLNTYFVKGLDKRSSKILHLSFIENLISISNFGDVEKCYLNLFQRYGYLDLSVVLPTHLTNVLKTLCKIDERTLENSCVIPMLGNLYQIPNEILIEANKLLFDEGLYAAKFAIYKHIFSKKDIPFSETCLSNEQIVDQIERYYEEEIQLRNKKFIKVYKPVVNVIPTIVKNKQKEEDVVQKSLLDDLNFDIAQWQKTVTMQIYGYVAKSLDHEPVVPSFVNPLTAEYPSYEDAMDNFGGIFDPGGTNGSY